RPVVMPGGEEPVVRTPGPRAHTARMGHFRGRLAPAGVPDLDGAVLPPGGQPRPVGAERHGTDRRLMPPENTEVPPGPRLPEVNGAVVEPGGERSAVRTPRDPPAGPPPAEHGRGPSQDQRRLFALDVPDADQAVGGALGESVAGDVPRHNAGPVPD